MFIAMVVFLCFGNYILQSNLISFQDKNRFKCTNEAAIGKSLKIANSDINDSEFLFLLIDLWGCSLLLPQKRASFFVCLYKTHANTQKALPVGTMNEWCKILTIKTLTEVNRT